MFKILAGLGLLGAPLGLVGVLASEGADGATDIAPWVQLGVTGLVLAGFFSRQIVSGKSYEEVRTDNAELRTENKRLVQLVLDTQHETIPALGAAAKALEETQAELRVMRRGG